MQCSVKNISDHYKLLSTVTYYLRLLHTIFDVYILLSTAICYFRPLHTTFSFTWLWFLRICGLKARLEFSIYLLALIQFWFFCSSIVSSVNFNYPYENAALLELLRCWKCEPFFTLHYKCYAKETSKPTIYVN